MNATDEAAASELIERMKDALQLAYNNGAFLCPLKGSQTKPDLHDMHCLPCQVAAWLAPRYLKPQEKLWADDWQTRAEAAEARLESIRQDAMEASTRDY